VRTSNPPVRVALVLAGLAGAMTTTGCSPTADTASARAGTTAASAPAATRVVTVKPERATIRRTTAEPGQIEAWQVTPLRAKVSGYVRSFAVHIGDRVKKGQVLAELHVPELEAEHQEKRALIEQAEADRKQAEAMVRVAEAAVASAEAKVAAVQAGGRRTEADVARWQAEYGRTGQLMRESAVTGTLLDETRSKLEAAQAARDEIRAQVKSAEAAKAQAVAERDKSRADVGSAAARVDVAKSEARRVEAMLGYTKIEAPFDGVVTHRDVDPGHLTTPGAAGEPIFVVASFDRVTITVGVPEADAPFVNPGDSAQVRLLALDGKTFEGKVTRTAWALDVDTRTLHVEIDLPNTDDVLRPGLYAYAIITTEEHKDALTLPATAIVKDGDKSFCMVVADGRAKRKGIKVGINEGKRTEVVSGLDGGEQVVEANAASLVDGQPVARSEPVAEAAKPKS
jgi:HlyD family secretion protein